MSFQRTSCFVAVIVLAQISFRDAPSLRHAAPTPDDFRAATAQRKAAQSKAMGNFLNSSLPFEANVGQTDRAAKFIGRGVGYTVFFTPRSVILSFADAQAKGRDNFVEMQIVGARDAQIKGLEPLASRSHYYRGNSSKGWQTDVPHYGKVNYTGVRPDTELVFYGRQGELEYDVVLGPHADPRDLVLQFSGAAHLSLNKDGDLVLALRNGREILQRRPKIFQQHDGRKTDVSGGYRLLASNRVRFEVGGYDRDKPLVIDPVLTYASYLGGSSTGNDYATSIALDTSGNAYIAGYTGSVGFPTGSVPPVQSHRAGGNDAFIAKLSADGTTLLYSTYLGGTSDDQANGIAVDPSGNIYVVGTTSSTDFPTTAGAYAPTQPAPGQNVFVAKFGAGLNLLYATYLGQGTGAAIAVDSSGSAYITGTAYCCIGFPTTVGAFQRTASSNDAFITKLNSAGSALVWSTLLGGTSTNAGNAIAIDSSLNVYVTGYTYSSNFPITSGAFQTALAGYANAFLTKMNTTGSAPVFSTYLGGNSYDQGNGIAVDSLGFAYVTGSAQSSNFPTTSGAYQTAINGFADAFVSKFNQAGTGLVYSTFLGGYSNGTAIAIDPSGNAYIAGNGSVPLSPGAYSNPSECCGFLAKLNSSGSALVYSSQPGFLPYLPGANLALDASGNVYLASYTNYAGHPVTPGAYQPFLAGGYDATIAKFNSSGTALVYSTFLGGPGGDQGLAITLDSTGSAYVTGSAGSLDFPVTTVVAGPLAAALGPATQVFVTKFNAAGTGLVYSTFVGGSTNDTGRAISVDTTGAVYVAGQTDSIDFPVTSAALQTTIGGGYDAFVFKLSATGQLVYSTFLGGSSDEDGRGLAVDSAGNAYVAGNTSSSNFLRTSTIGNPSTFNPNVFVAKINPTGSGYLYSAVLGGSYLQSESGLALDSTGSAYITGYTYSSDFPVTPGAYQTFFVGSPAFVSKLNSTGSALLYSTFLGGQNSTYGSAIAVDASGDAYVTGYTNSPNFPVSAGAFQTLIGGPQNAFVTKLNPSGSALSYSTYLGGSGFDQGNAIAVDSSGNAYVAGSTQSSNFPTANGATIMEVVVPGYYSSAAFATSLNASGTGLQYSTYLGSGATSANAISVLPGIAVVAGTTSGSGSELIGSSPGFQKSLAPNAQNAFVTAMSNPPAGCTYSVSPTSFNVGSSGGTETVNVSAATGCPWIAVAPAGSRVQLNPAVGGVVGSGNGSVTFTISPDTYQFDSGSVSLFTVAGQLVTVTQMAPCPISLASSSITTSPEAAAEALAFSAPSCNGNLIYTTTPWIATPTSYAYGSGTASFQVLANPSATSRTGFVYIGPQTFTIKQLGTQTTTATMLSPAPGTALPGQAVTFSWTPISGAQAYRLAVGTSLGTANICSTQTTSTQFTCSSLPVDGSTVYVQLRTENAGVWGQLVQYEYTAATPSLAQLLSPAPATSYPGTPTTVLPANPVNFSWSPGIGADQYQLDVGSTVGGSDICSITTTSTLAACNSLPCNGSTVYAQISTHWAAGFQPPNQYVYLACTATLGVITSPIPLSTLPGSAVTFKWRAGVGADNYAIYVGTTVNSGNICKVPTTTTQYTCKNIPTNGAPIYVQLYTHENGAWQGPNRYTYTAALP